MNYFQQNPINSLAGAIEMLNKSEDTNSVFEFIGILLLLTAFIFGHGLTGYSVLIFGCLIILITFGFTLYFKFKKYKEIKHTAELVQAITSQMAEMTTHLIQLHTRYHEGVDQVVKSIQQFIEITPALKQVIEELIPNFEDIMISSDTIHSLLKDGKHVADNLNDALTSNNIERLQAYLSDIRSYEQRLKDTLNK